jgi:colicin import membrane protein
MADTTPYQVPKEPGRWRALTLAVVVHLALLVFLYIGIRWQSETPQAVEAEVWGQQTKEAAPKPRAEPPQPEAKPEPKPQVKEPPKAVEQPKENPDIALEQEKKRLAKERERLEKVAAELKARQKAEEEAAKKAAAAKLKESAASKAAEQRRLDELKRMTGEVGSGGSGAAPKSQSPGRADPDYQNRIAAKILSNIIFNVPPDLAGNPPVEFAVNLLPDGSVASIRKVKPSGVPGFDEAVQRAIEKSQPYPKDKSGTVPSSFIGIHKPKDK